MQENGLKKYSVQSSLKHHPLWVTLYLMIVMSCTNNFNWVIKHWCSNLKVSTLDIEIKSLGITISTLKFRPLSSTISTLKFRPLSSKISTLKFRPLSSTISTLKFRSLSSEGPFLLSLNSHLVLKRSFLQIHWTNSFNDFAILFFLIIFKIFKILFLISSHDHDK